VTNLLNVNPLEFPKPPHVPVPDARSRCVLFLLGDGGELTDRSPLLRRQAPTSNDGPPRSSATRPSR
jgi:hypothetical protein